MSTEMLYRLVETEKKKLLLYFLIFNIHLFSKIHLLEIGRYIIKIVRAVSASTEGKWNTNVLKLGLTSWGHFLLLAPPPRPSPLSPQQRLLLQKLLLTAYICSFLLEKTPSGRKMTQKLDCTDAPAALCLESFTGTRGMLPRPPPPLREPIHWQSSPIPGKAVKWKVLAAGKQQLLQTALGGCPLMQPTS